ncbi:hypothetical protein TNIN_84251 [Trichonephila inaurata madagascariensis]|uniref:Uncharacterized protein n=1 Tax=Trichonephila inaurata madagascariensis TaxID=2747483 RepID=A0A8X6XFP1_9ARAC|nr:hypothetical protein TNIN_84251 [Trichonephila inaurata madagascariensis]
MLNDPLIILKEVTSVSKRHFQEWMRLELVTTDHLYEAEDRYLVVIYASKNCQELLTVFDHLVFFPFWLAWRLIRSTQALSSSG